MNDSGPIVLTGEQIVVARLMTLAACLRIEIKTGMRHSRGSILKLCQREGLTQAKNKRDALTDLENKICELNPRYVRRGT